jgi:hypothetical protein
MATMFVGHLAVGLALKKAEPKLNLGVLFLAVMLLDFLLGVFVLLGLEQVHVPADYARLHYLTFTFPYSHGLLASLVWSALASLLTWVLTKRHPWGESAALIVGFAVFSHFLCDVIEHIPEMPIIGESSPKLGLGLWNQMGAAMALEVGMIIVGLALYLTAAPKVRRGAKYGLVALMAVFSVMNVVGQLGASVAPERSALVGQWLTVPWVVAALACWLDRADAKESGPTGR